VILDVCGGGWKIIEKRKKKKNGKRFADKEGGDLTVIGKWA